MFPFASHDKYGYTLEYAEKELKVTSHEHPCRPHLMTSVFAIRLLATWQNGMGIDSRRTRVRSVNVFHFSLYPTHSLMQFTQLGSPREVVVDAAIRDLECTCV